MNYKRITRVLLFSVFFPLFAFAANEVSISDSVTFVLPSDGTEYSATGGTFDSVTINDSNFSFSISGGSSVEIVSADKKKYTVSPSSLATFTCESSQSRLFITKPTGDATETVTVTPSGTCTGSSSGASSSGGGGGGGNGPILSLPPPTPYAPVTSSSTFVVATSTKTVPASTPAVHSATFVSDLSLGMESADVSRLQTLLASDSGIYPEGLVTGYFGALTRAAVRRFQEKYGVPPAGRVGPLTRARLAEVFGGGQEQGVTPVISQAAVISSMLSLGSQGEEVRTLQTFLATDPAIYPEALVTGYFGALTRAAVRRFQEKYSIASQGVAGYGTVGPKTRAKLNELFGK